MKSDLYIYENGEHLHSESDSEVSHYKDGSLVQLDGCYYPYRDQIMQNPLDPANLLLCAPVFVEDSCSDEDSDGKGTEFVERVLNTLLHATDLREKGYKISTAYNSGAPRAIIQNGTENTIILGEYSKTHGLLLPLLSTQLADSRYRQENIDVWKERGFTTPPKYKCYVSTYNDNLEGRQYGTMAYVSFGYKEQTYYNVYGGGLKITIVKKHSELEIEDYEDDDDGSFEGREYTNWRIEKVERTPDHPVSSKPKFVWQDKGEKDE